MLHFREDRVILSGFLWPASMIQDEAPWLYELAMEAYRALQSGDPTALSNVN